MRKSVLISAVVLCASSAMSQTAHVAYGGGPVTDAALPNGACTATVAQLPGYFFPPQPAVAPPPAGALAFDHLSNLLFVSEGLTIEAFPHPLYPPAGPFVPGPFPLPVAPCPLGPIGAAFGPITGMAIMPGAGPAAGMLLVTDGVCIMGLAPVAPYVMVMPPFPALPPGAGAGLITGLEFDSGTGIIWACDAGGVSYPIAPGGGPAGPPIPPAVVPAAPIAGNVLDRSVVGGALYNTDGLFLYPVFPAGPPLPLPPAAAAGIVAPPLGATFVAEPVSLGGGCACGFGPATASTSTTTAGGTGIPISVAMTGGVPGAPAWLGIDTLCGPPIAFGGCTWWLPNPPLVLVGPLPLDAAGSAVVPFAALPAGLAGTAFYAQWAFACPTTATGLALTNALHGAVSLP